MPGETQEFDMSAALDSVSSGLGLELDNGDDDGGLDLEGTGDGGQGAGGESGAAGEGAAGAGGTGAGGGEREGTGEGDGSAPSGTEGGAAEDLNSAPRTWRKEAAAAWATLPPTVRAEIHKREQDIFRGLEEYRGAANFGRTFQQALAPYMPLLEQYRVDPVAQVSGLMRAHQTLVTGTPQQKQEFFAKLAQDYGVDLGQLSSGEPSFVDPAVQGLQQKLQTLESTVTAAEAARRADAIQAQTRQVETFAADPKNVYFKDVANDMVRLLETKVCSTLEEAYQQAIWLNPAVRQREIDRQQTERAAAERKAAEERAAAARKAAGPNVRTTAKSGGGAAPTGSMDDTLKETLALIQSRSS